MDGWIDGCMDVCMYVTNIYNTKTSRPTLVYVDMKPSPGLLLGSVKYFAIIQIASYLL